MKVMAETGTTFPLPKALSTCGHSFLSQSFLLPWWRVGRRCHTVDVVPRDGFRGGHTGAGYISSVDLVFSFFQSCIPSYTGAFSFSFFLRNAFRILQKAFKVLYQYQFLFYCLFVCLFIYLFIFKRGGFTMLIRLVLNSRPQVIRPTWPPKVLGLQA